MTNVFKLDRTFVGKEELGGGMHSERLAVAQLYDKELEDAGNRRLDKSNKMALPTTPNVESTTAMETCQKVVFKR